LALSLAVASGRRLWGDLAEPLPDRLFRVRSFVLVDQDGREVADTDLRGGPWIAAFVFTSCRTICPTITTTMANVARRLQDETRVRFVSFTVDPETDTPEVLRAYAQRHRIDTRRWRLLTGEPARVREVVESGLRQPAGAREAMPDVPGEYEIVHARRLLLVDGDGYARGLYGLGAQELVLLERHARALARAD
jgi:protein SCO1/2